MFVNLLVNAAQAIPEGDPARHEVRVSTAHRVVGERRFVVASIDEVEHPCLEKPFDPEALRAFTRDRIR